MAVVTAKANNSATTASAATASATTACAANDTELPVVRAYELPTLAAGAKWLVRDIWGQQSVGILGGAPKCAKSWFGLDMAISVASRTLCLGHFAVDDPGPTLVYLAEDALPQVRERIAGICAHRRLDLCALDLHVITAPAVRLDLDADKQRLEATLARLRPKLLLLDPLVRLHRLDENSAADVSVLLGFLREMQRRYETAIALVHHMSKRNHPQLGQALRGSSDIHAWSDDNAYLTRQSDKLRLTLEHRSAPATEPLGLRLVADPDGGAAHLELADASRSAGAVRSLRDDILDALAAEKAPLSRAELRAKLRINNCKLGEALLELEKSQRIVRSDTGLTLASFSTNPPIEASDSKR